MVIWQYQAPNEHFVTVIYFELENEHVAVKALLRWLRFLVTRTCDGNRMKGGHFYKFCNIHCTLINLNLSLKSLPHKARALFYNIILFLFKISMVVAVPEDGETQPDNDSKGNFLASEESQRRVADYNRVNPGSAESMN